MKMTIQESIKQTIHSLDLIIKPYALFANPSDIVMIKDLVPDNIKLIELNYVEKGKVYLIDRKYFEMEYVPWIPTIIESEDKE